MEREIVVRGTGQARTLPDTAGLRVEVTADAKTHDDAYATRTEMAAKVDAVLAAHADAIERTTVAALRVQPRTRWHRGEDIRTGWRASRTSFVEVKDLDALGALMGGLVEAGAAIQGPQWTISPSNPAHDEARRAAATDARSRADSYARALGLGLGSVAWVAEPGLRGAPGGPRPVATEARMVMAAQPAEAPEPAEDLSPSEMTVEATVEVGFTIA
ncbi:MAG TPA: SIMPL domain-containing protein [Acidimicrobiales bacterium]